MMFTDLIVTVKIEKNYKKKNLKERKSYSFFGNESKIQNKIKSLQNVGSMTSVNTFSHKRCK